MKKKKTQRGFDIAEFKDCNGHKCSLQESSSGMERRISDLEAKLDRS